MEFLQSMFDNLFKVLFYSTINKERIMKYLSLLCILTLLIASTDAKKLDKRKPPIRPEGRILMPSCGLCDTAVLPGDSCKCGAVKDKTNDDDNEETRRLMELVPITNDDYILTNTEQKSMLRGGQ